MGIIVVHRERLRGAARDRERVRRVLLNTFVDAGPTISTFLEEGLEERRRLDHGGGDRVRARRQVGPLVLDHGLHTRLGARDVGPGHGLGVLHRRAGCGGIVEELLREAQIGIPQAVVQRIIIPVQHVLESLGQRISCTIQLLRELASI